MTTTKLPVAPTPEAACTTCVCTTPAPASCDHATPCFPIYPETSDHPSPTPTQDELELLCGVER